jgi:CRP-like cAMP-binding protein
MDETRLRAVPLFAKLDRQQLSKVAQLADEIDLPAHQELITQGTLAYEFFVITRGSARVTINGEPVAEPGPGDFFGEIGAVNNVRRNATVTTTTPVTVIVITARDLRRIEREMPKLHEALAAAIAQRSSPRHAQQKVS